MSKFTFICEDEPMPFSESIVSKKTIEFDGESLYDILQQFEFFLKSCGYNLDKKELKIENVRESFEASDDNMDHLFGK
jgi:hypothetical protein